MLRMFWFLALLRLKSIIKFFFILWIPIYYNLLFDYLEGSIIWGGLLFYFYWIDYYSSPSSIIINLLSCESILICCLINSGFRSDSLLLSYITIIYLTTSLVNLRIFYLEKIPQYLHQDFQPWNVLEIAVGQSVSKIYSQWPVQAYLSMRSVRNRFS